MLIIIKRAKDLSVYECQTFCCKKVVIGSSLGPFESDTYFDIITYIVILFFYSCLFLSSYLIDSFRLKMYAHFSFPPWVRRPWAVLRLSVPTWFDQCNKFIYKIYSHKMWDFDFSFSLYLFLLWNTNRCRCLRKVNKLNKKNPLSQS